MRLLGQFVATRFTVNIIWNTGGSLVKLKSYQCEIEGSTHTYEILQISIQIVLSLNGEYTPDALHGYQTAEDHGPLVEEIHVQTKFAHSILHQNLKGILAPPQ